MYADTDKPLLRWKPIAVLATAALLASACSDDDDDDTAAPPAEEDSLLRSADFPGITCQTLDSVARDGTVLTAVLYLPEDVPTGGLPTIVHRTPYAMTGFGTGCFTNSGIDLDAYSYAREDYAYLYQHARGTWTSEGDFDIFRQERNDGYDAVEWAATQAWSNGDVGIRGPSYMGATAWQATIANPPSLKAASISISSEDYHREWVYENGIPHHSMNVSWPELAFVADQITRQETARGTSEEDIADLITQRQALANEGLWSDWVWRLPLTSLDVFDGLVDSYDDWMQHPSYDTFWQELDVAEDIPDVQIPVMIHGAWYDIFGNGSLTSFQSMREQAGSEIARTQTHLLMTPYGHATDHGTPSFGPEPDGALAAPTGELQTHKPYDLDYFDRYLKQIDSDYDNQAVARLHVMVPPDEGNEGSTFLLEADDYPPKDMVQQAYYLSSNGDANNRDGSGALSTTPTTQDAGISADAAIETAGPAADLFQYDPANPVPTAGGNLCCGTDFHPQGPKSGAVEQADIEVRDDVLVYTSEPLTEDLLLVGPVSVQLFAKSSATDTDFTAKLVDVRPDGQTHNILDAAVRASLREGSKSQPSLIEPDRTYEYTIPLGHTAVVFPAGHRIRLQISSSNFPKLARNLNTGLSNTDSAEMMVADQAILHDASHPSRLILPVLDASVTR